MGIVDWDRELIEEMGGGHEKGGCFLDCEDGAGVEWCREFFERGMGMWLSVDKETVEAWVVVGVFGFFYGFYRFLSG